MGHAGVQALLVAGGADPAHEGAVLVPEHIPKVKDFYSMDGGAAHPLPSAEFMAWRNEADLAAAEEATSLIPGM